MNPSLPDSPSLYSFNLSEGKYYKWRLCAKKDKTGRQSKMRSWWPYQNLFKDYSQALYSRTRTKDHKVQIGLGSTTAPDLFPDFFQIAYNCLSHLKETYMLLMDYTSTREEELPYCDKKFTWKILYSYIDVHSQILIDKCTGDGVRSISIFQYQCANMTFSNQIMYNRLFH